MSHPISGIPISTLNLPRRVRVVDLPKALRAAGYVLVIAHGQLLAVRIH